MSSPDQIPAPTPQLTDAEQAAVDHAVDTRGISVEHARADVLGLPIPEGPKLPEPPTEREIARAKAEQINNELYRPTSLDHDEEGLARQADGLASPTRAQILGQLGILGNPTANSKRTTR